MAWDHARRSYCHLKVAECSLIRFTARGSVQGRWTHQKGSRNTECAPQLDIRAPRPGGRRQRFPDDPSSPIQVGPLAAYSTVGSCKVVGTGMGVVAAMTRTFFCLHQWRVGKKTGWLGLADWGVGTVSSLFRRHDRVNFVGRARLCSLVRADVPDTSRDPTRPRN